MHKKIASEKFVPAIGDVMTSRWAYEALMVTQFKDNRFEKQFYNTENEIHNAIYYKSFCLPQLYRLGEESEKLKNTGQDSIKLSQKPVNH